MVVEHTLDQVGPLVARFAGTPFVLDHCGFSTDERLEALGRYDNLFFKVSSITLGALDDPAAFVRWLADRVGAARLLWGSDYPHTHHVPYGQLVALGISAARRLSPAERAAYLGETAVHLWPLPPVM